MFLFLSASSSQKNGNSKRDNDSGKADNLKEQEPNTNLKPQKYKEVYKELKQNIKKKEKDAIFKQVCYCTIPLSSQCIIS